jgi:hypothetical protein
VAAACALIQSFQLAAMGTPLSPADLRQLLIDTGWTQQGEGQDGHIGPAVNIKKALQTRFPGPVAAPEAVPAGGSLLLTSHPNPFRASTTIHFDSPGTSSVSVRIFDVAGREVRALVEGTEWNVGSHRVIWDGRDGAGRELPSGVYFLRLEAGEREGASRVVLMK